MNTIAIASMMTLIMSISVSSLALAQETELRGGDRGESERSATHVELEDDHEELQVAEFSDGSGSEVYQLSNANTKVSNDHWGSTSTEVRVANDDHNNRQGPELSDSIPSNNNASSTSNSAASIQSRMAELMRIVESLLEQLRRQVGL